jgi:hypothetical protein
MIYLFEDRQERMKQYYGSDKLPYGIIRAVLDYDRDSELDLTTYLAQSFPDAEGALFHKSYRGNESELFLSQVQDYFINQGLFFVFFSGGIESANYIPVNGTWQASVNSRTFYDNLSDFAVAKDVRILCFGENFKFNEYLNCIRDIQVELSKLTANASPFIDVVVMLNVLARYKGSFPELNEVIEKLMNWLADSKAPIAVEVFANQIHKAFQLFSNL